MGIFKKIFSSVIKRPAKNWNIENRAQKVLDKQKDLPNFAPKHPSTVDKLETFNREHPELLEAQRMKSESLHKMLDGMVVNPDKVSEIQAKSRPLPENRTKQEDPEFGYSDPEAIPSGKCSIRQALDFITANQIEPETFTVSYISRKYNLQEEKIENVLRYFQTLEMQMPKGAIKPEELHMGAVFPKNQKLIPSKDSDPEKAGS